MGSFRVVSPVAAVLLLGLTSLNAHAACTCGEGAQNTFSKSDLVVKGRMKAVIYGDRLPEGSSGGIPLRGAWGEVEIVKVLKGRYSQPILPVYTGAGLGYCSRLGEFLNAAVNYDHEALGEFELGLTKGMINGRVLYVSEACNYAKGPQFKEAIDQTDQPPSVE